MIQFDVENTEPDIFRDSSEKDMAWVGSQAEVEVTDDHDHVAENMSSETDNAESDNSAVVMEDGSNVIDDHDPVAENIIIEIEGRNINIHINVYTNILVNDYNKIASRKVNIENENSATIHSDVNSTDPGIFRDTSNAMSHSDMKSTDPDVELSKDTSFIRDKTGEVIDKDNSLKRLKIRDGVSIIDEKYPLVENMGIETEERNINSEVNDADVVVEARE